MSGSNQEQKENSQSALATAAGMQKFAACESGFLVTREENNQVCEAWFWGKGEKSVRYESGNNAAALMEAADSLSDCWRKSLDREEMVLPTGFDLQVHLRHPGQPHKETLSGGMASALAGGYDSFLTMPNTKPFLFTPEPMVAAMAQADRECPSQYGWPKVYFSGAGTIEMQGEEVADIAALAKAGAVAITDDGWGVKSEKAMADIFQRCADVDLPFLQHAEMPGHGGHASPSAYQEKHGIPAYPRTAESEMVARDVALLKKAPRGTRYHVLHISTRETLAEIRKAKEAGLNLTCEVTPHHLYFANTDFPEPNDSNKHTDFKMNPPIFAPEDRQALREALEEGLIDCVSTDHAPHEEEAKRDAWQYAGFGTRGLVTSLPTLVTLHAAGLLSAERLKEVYAFGGRKVLGEAKVQGPTGIVIVDKNESWSVQPFDLPGISQNSCFIGANLKGRVQTVLQPGFGVGLSE